MAPDSYFAFRRAPADNDNVSLRGAYLPAEWSERTVTMVAVTAGVAVVALIAVLMGAIGP